MGDMADYLVESQMLDWMEELYTIPESWEKDYRTVRRFKTCRYCGKSGLVWHKFQNKWWALTDGNIAHSCREYKMRNKFENSNFRRIV